MPLSPAATPPPVTSRPGEPLTLPVLPPSLEVTRVQVWADHVAPETQPPTCPPTWGRLTRHSADTPEPSNEIGGTRSQRGDPKPLYLSGPRLDGPSSVTTTTVLPRRGNRKGGWGVQVAVGRPASDPGLASPGSDGHDLPLESLVEGRDRHVDQALRDSRLPYVPSPPTRPHPRVRCLRGPRLSEDRSQPDSHPLH